MTSAIKPAGNRITRLPAVLARVGALPPACAALPLVVLVANAHPPAPLLPSVAVLAIVLMTGLTALVRGYAAVGLIEILSGDLRSSAVRQRAISLRRARFFALMCAASLTLLWLPVFWLRLSGAVVWPAWGDAYLLGLPLLRAARLYDLCARLRPPERLSYAYDLVTTRIGKRACAIGHVDLGMSRFEFLRAYLRG